MGQLVEVTIESGVAVVAIANPPMNVMNQAVGAELLDAFRSLEHADDVVVVVLCGKGERAFMAGADIKEFPRALGQPGAAFALAQGLHALMDCIDHFPKPVIAALHGFVLGGGMELALACDLRVCEEGTKLGLPEINLGIFPGAGGTQRLPRLIGEARAKEMMFTGTPVTAQWALQSGLVNRVVPTGQALVAARELASEIAGKSLPALSRIKQAVDEGSEATLAVGTWLEARLFDEVFQTSDSREGVTAFIEKRQAHFTNR
ncbi:MAG: enoyl-CoA hydratase-related protein [Firmicutes bacterium]|nr:enoyl-CoA hydratase-related protein [Bacillota bacterium]